MITTLERQRSSMDCIIDRYLNEADWLAARQSRIGASDTAGIFGVGYADQSGATVWDSKLRPPEEPTPAKRKLFKIGKMMEPTLRAIFTEETGLPCESLGDFTICTHPDLPWLGASLDGVTEHPEHGPAVVELKNVSNFAREEWDSDEPPLKYGVQVQHQLAVTGCARGYLLGLIGGNEPIVKVIDRNERFITAMLARLEEFWGYVQRRELPPVDESRATSQLLAKLWPRDNATSILLPAEATEWDRELTEAKAAIKAAEAVKTAAENKLKAALGENAYGDLPGGGSYSWKTQERKAYIVEAGTMRVLRRGK